MKVPSASCSSCAPNAFSVAVTKMQLDGAAAQGKAANDLIQAAGEVNEDAVKEQGVGRRVDVEA